MIKEDIKRIFRDIRPTKYEIEDAFAQLCVDVRVGNGGVAGQISLPYVNQEGHLEIIQESLQYWLPCGVKIRVYPVERFDAT